jgi:integrase
MGRHAGAYSLRKWANGFWYYRLRGEKSYRTTGTREYEEALRLVEEKLRTAESLEASPARRSLREYSAVFFIWGKCPHCQKLIDEGRQITKRHAYNQRRWLENYILTDTIADKQIEELTRADVLDFRSRIARQLGAKVNTANKVLAVLKTILKEAVFREDLTRDPTAGVGNLKENRKEAGIFTAEELRALFPLEGLGPWADLQTKTCFLVAATTGMRRGEILALSWKHIDFEHSLIRIEQAWKSKDELGSPKWGRKRVVPLPTVTATALQDLWDSRPVELAGADSLVFCYADIERAYWGERLGDTWWMKNFVAAMKKVKLQEDGKEKIGIDARARGIKPHSFRHTVATLRRDAGEDPAKIRAALGWTNERTQENYEHFTVDMLRSTTIEAIWASQN